MPLSVGKVFGLLELTDNFSQRIEDAANKLAASSTRIERIGNNIANVGDKMTTAISLPIALVGGGAIKAAIDFEASFAGVRKTLDTTGLSASQAEKAFADMANEIRGMAQRMPLSVNEINRVAEAAGQLGIRRQDVVAFSETMIKMGTATNLTADEAATAMARFSNIMAEPASNVDKLGAAIVALGNNGASTEKEIVDMGLRLAGAGKTIGLTSAQVLGMANALSSLGIEAEMGGSAMSKMMIKIASAASSGGESLGQFAKIAHMTTEEFATLFKQDPGAAIGKFIEGLGKTKAEGGDLLKTLSDLDISETRLRDTMLRVANAGSMVTDSMKLGTDAFRENTALNNEYEQRLKTTQAQLVLFRNKIYDIGITLGQTLIPAMMKVVDAAMPLLHGIESMVVAFSKLPEPVQTFSIGLLAVVAAIGPVLSWGGRLVSLLGAIAGFFGGGGAAAGAAGAAGAVGGGLAAGTLAFGAALVTLGGAGLYGLLKVGDAAKGLGEAFRSGKTWVDSFEKSIDFLRARHETFLSRWTGTFTEAKIPNAHTKTPTDIYLPPDTPAAATGAGLPAATASATQFADAIRDADNSIKNLSKTKLNDVIAGIKSGAFGMKELQEMSGLSEVAIERLKSRIQDQTKVAKEAQKDNKELQKIMSDMADKVEYGLTPAFEKAFPPIINYNDAAHKLALSMMGWDKIDDATEMVKGLSAAQEMGVSVSQMTRDTQAQINKTVGEAIDAYRNLGLVAPDALNKLYIATAQLPEATKGIFGSIGKEMPMPQIPTLPPTFFEQMFGGDFGSKLANAIMGAFQGGGNVGKTIGGLFGNQLGDMAGKTASKAIGGLLGSTLGSMIPGIGTLLGGSLGSWLSKGFSALFGGKGEGRSMVEDFAKTFDTSAAGTGFDELHTKLMALNTDGSQVGENLWRQLTQGVGKNNPEQAKAAIDAITAALDAQAKKQTEAGKAAQDAATAQTEATAKVKSRIADLDSEYDKLFQSIQGEAPEEAMGVVERETRERMAAIEQERAALEEQLHRTLESWTKTEVPPIRIPYYYDREGPDLPESPDSQPFDDSSGGKTTQTITVNLDGRRIGRAAAENMPDELEVQGV